MIKFKVVEEHTDYRKVSKIFDIELPSGGIVQINKWQIEDEISGEYDGGYDLLNDTKLPVDDEEYDALIDFITNLKL